MLDADIKIVQTSETRSYDRNGKGTAYLRVEFMIGDHGPFVEKFPKDGFTAMGRDDTLNTFAREIRT